MLFKKKRKTGRNHEGRGHKTGHKKTEVGHEGLDKKEKNEVGHKNENDGGKHTYAGCHKFQGQGEMIKLAHMNTQASRAEVSQSETCTAILDSCKQSNRQTGLEVERLSQIKTQRTDQLGIHMCVCSITQLSSATSQHDTTST